MKRVIICLLATIGLFPLWGQPSTLRSPDGRMELRFEVKDSVPYYSLSRDGRAVVLPSKMGFTLEWRDDMAHAFVVKDIKICGISYETTQKYHSDPDCFFQSIAILRTEYSKQDAGIRLGVNSVLDREKAIVKTVNGREFSYLQLGYDKDTHMYYQGAIDVLWAENGVTYYFHIVYYDNCREKAEQIAEEWMESFH